MKLVGDDDDVRQWQREQAKRGFEEQLAALSDAEKAGYDAATLELNQSHPLPKAENVAAADAAGLRA